MLDHIQELKITDDKVILNGNTYKISETGKGYKLIRLGIGKLYLHKLIAAYKYSIPMRSIDRYNIIFKDNDKSNLSYDNIEIRLKSFVYDGTYTINGIKYKTNERMPLELIDKLVLEGFLKKIPDCKYGTYVGRNGVVIRRDGQIRALAVSSDGYLRLEYRSKKGKVKKQLHRVVAQLFIPPYVYYNGEKVINHKDGNRKNNHVNNLEWVTQKENIIYSHKNGFVKRDFRIILEDLKTGKKKEFYSLRYLGRELKVLTSVNVLVTIFKVTEKYPLYDRYKFNMVNKELLTATDGDVKYKVKVNNEVKEFETLMRLATYYGISYKRLSAFIRERVKILKFKDIEIESVEYRFNKTNDYTFISLLNDDSVKINKIELESLIKKQALEEVLKI